MSSIRKIVRPRRRTLAIVVRETGDVEVLVPPNMPEARVDTFLATKTDWIAAKVAALSQARSPWPAFSLAPGATLPFLGRALTLVPVAGNGKPRRIGDALVIRLPDCLAENRETVARTQIVGWYREQAQRHLPERVQCLAGALRLRPGQLSVRDYRRRWGACFRDGRIALNWRLIMLPETIVDYVVVHELCHLVHHDHSPHFYRLLAEHAPNWRSLRNWLRDNGHFLPI